MRGGIPEPKAMAKPLCYKVSWNFDMVLVSQNRDSVMIEDGKRVEVPAGRQHDNRFIHDYKIQFEVNQRLQFQLLLCKESPHFYVSDKLPSLSVPFSFDIQQAETRGKGDADAAEREMNRHLAQVEEFYWQARSKNETKSKRTAAPKVGRHKGGRS